MPTTTNPIGYFHFFGDMLADMKKRVSYAGPAIHVVLEEMMVENVDTRNFHSFEDFINRLSKQCGIVITMDGKLGSARYTYQVTEAVPA